MTFGEVEVGFYHVQFYVFTFRARFFYSQFWNENGWYRMHSQHSVHSAPGSRMDGMAFCPFRNMMQNKRTCTFHILAIPIPELSIKKRALNVSDRNHCELLTAVWLTLNYLFVVNRLLKSPARRTRNVLQITKESKVISTFDLLSSLSCFSSSSRASSDSMFPSLAPPSSKPCIPVS